MALYINLKTKSKFLFFWKLNYHYFILETKEICYINLNELIYFSVKEINDQCYEIKKNL